MSRVKKVSSICIIVALFVSVAFGVVGCKGNKTDKKETTTKEAPSNSNNDPVKSNTVETPVEP